MFDFFLSISKFVKHLIVEYRWLLSGRKKWACWNAEILHWIGHTILGYMLMLSVMTYNGYIAISLIIGAGIGYWIFGRTLIQLNLEHYKRAHDRITRCNVLCAGESMFDRIFFN